MSVSVDVSEHELAEALILSGRLTESEALQPAKVQCELHVLIRDYIARWRNA